MTNPTVADEWLDWLARYARCGPLPKVRALHLPPLASAGSKNGEFCALELDDGAIGLSYVMLDGTLARLSEGAGVPPGASALSLARGYLAADPAQRAVGFAAINALTRSLFDRSGFVPEDSSDSIGELDPQADERIGMIGLFTPLVGRFIDAGAQLTVLELKPELQGAREGYRVTLDRRELAACEKILSTSTVLLNHTLDAVLTACTSARRFAMIGPGAGCLPDPLFARGVTSLGGSWVLDRQGFVEALRSGGAWGVHARKFTLHRDRYPGGAALLARLSG
ncbi:MAG: Rossmann-like domain-containing protein [Rhodocyclaceae bacterium]